MSRLTVKEYADLHCISVQAVYKKINTLKTIEEVKNGRKQIFIIVGEEEPKPKEEEIKPSSTVNSTPAASTSTPQEQAASTVNSTPAASTSTAPIQPISTYELNPALLEMLQAQIQEKDKQIEEKDKQIERLQNAADEKDRQIKDQFERLSALLLRSQELEALTHRLLLGQGEAAEEPPQEGDKAEVIETEPPKTEEAPPQDEDQEPPKKEGFFSRLIKRIKGE